MQALLTPDGRVAQVTAERFDVAGPLRWVDCPQDTQPGATFANGAFTPPATAAQAVLVPQQVSRRQLLIGLAADGLITGAEALAAARTGDMPAGFASVVAALPAADQLAAQVTWATMGAALRSDPLLAAAAAAHGKSDADLDAMFTRWAAL